MNPRSRRAGARAVSIMAAVMPKAAGFPVEPERTPKPVGRLDRYRSIPPRLDVMMAIGILKTAGHASIAATCRDHARDATRPLDTLGLRPARAKRTRRGYAETLGVAVLLCHTVIAWPSQRGEVAGRGLRSLR